MGYLSLILAYNPLFVCYVCRWGLRAAFRDSLQMKLQTVYCLNRAVTACNNTEKKGRGPREGFG